MKTQYVPSGSPAAARSFEIMKRVAAGDLQIAIGTKMVKSTMRVKNNPRWEPWISRTAKD